MLTINELYDNDALEISKANIEWDCLEGKTVLLTGATGYVPQYIVHGIMKRNELYHSNIKLIALCRDEKKARDRFEKYLNNDLFLLMVQNLEDKIHYDNSIDYIIHAASPAGNINSNIDPLTTFNVNVKGTESMLKLAKEKKSIFMLFSSVDVYGRNEKGLRFTEDYSGALDSLNIRNVYACAKRSSETLCACYSAQGVETRIIRPVQILGGGISLSDGRLHIDFISQILKNSEIVIKGDGSPIRSFIYVTDVISAILKILIKGENNQVYNICNESGEASVREFADIMAGCANKEISISYNMETRNTDPSVKHAVSVVTASSEKLRSLGWKAEISLKQACEKMMGYYGI